MSSRHAPAARSRIVGAAVPCVALAESGSFGSVPAATRLCQRTHLGTLGSSPGPCLPDPLPAHPRVQTGGSAPGRRAQAEPEHRRRATPTPRPRRRLAAVFLELPGSCGSPLLIGSPEIRFPIDVDAQPRGSPDLERERQHSEPGFSEASIRCRWAFGAGTALGGGLRCRRFGCR